MAPLEGTTADAHNAPAKVDGCEVIVVGEGVSADRGDSAIRGVQRGDDLTPDNKVCTIHAKGVSTTIVEVYGAPIA